MLKVTIDAAGRERTHGRTVSEKNWHPTGLDADRFCDGGRPVFCQAVLIPLAIAILLAFLIAPVVARLERTPLGRVIAVLITVG